MTELNGSPARRGQTRLPAISAHVLGIYLAAALFVLLGVLNHTFLTRGNLRDVAVSACINAIIGLGLTFVIITGGIDLSIGSIASLGGIVSASLIVNHGVPPVAGLAIGIVTGLVCGLANGVLVTGLRLPPFIATLGTMSVFQGCAFVMTNGNPVYNVPSSFVAMLNGYIGGFPVVVVLVLAALTNGLVLLNVPSFYEQIVTGTVVIVAVSVDQGAKGWPMLAARRTGPPGGADAGKPATGTVPADAR